MCSAVLRRLRRLTPTAAHGSCLDARRLALPALPVALQRTLEPFVNRSRTARPQAREPFARACTRPREMFAPPPLVGVPPALWNARPSDASEVPIQRSQRGKEG